MTKLPRMAASDISSTVNAPPGAAVATGAGTCGSEPPGPCEQPKMSIVAASQVLLMGAPLIFR
jgi:hypothetical protein